MAKEKQKQSKSVVRIARFKKPGDTLSIGGQTFHQGNISPEIVEALINIDERNGDHFEILEQDHVSILEEPKPEGE